MEITNLKTIQKNFLKELQDASNGKKTSLPFLIHQLPSVPLVKKGERFQVIGIGGSIYDSALVAKKGNGITILQHEHGSVPKFETAEIFLSFVENIVRDDISIIALNFAFPMNPIFSNGKLGGILLAGSKEHAFNGLIGKSVGEALERHLQKTKKNIYSIALANDIVCLLLSGLSQYPKHLLASGIVGTGINFAFFLDENHAVNLESANFARFPQSKEGKEIDKASVSPCDALFEKETSGAYLYQHFNLLLKKRNIDFPAVASTRELNDVVLQNIPIVSQLAQELFDYSASLFAAQLAGLAEFKKTNLTIVMQGAVFHSAHNYRATVEKCLKKLVPQYAITLTRIDQSAILGAAKLVA